MSRYKPAMTSLQRLVLTWRLVLPMQNRIVRGLQWLILVKTWWILKWKMKTASSSES